MEGRTGYGGHGEMRQNVEPGGEGEGTVHWLGDNPDNNQVQEGPRSMEHHRKDDRTLHLLGGTLAQEQKAPLTLTLEAWGAFHASS